jgi:hypothetical protein
VALPCSRSSRNMPSSITPNCSAMTTCRNTSKLGRILCRHGCVLLEHDFENFTKSGLMRLASSLAGCRTTYIRSRHRYRYYNRLYIYDRDTVGGALPARIDLWGSRVPSRGACMAVLMVLVAARAMSSVFWERELAIRFVWGMGGAVLRLRGPPVLVNYTYIIIGPWHAPTPQRMVERQQLP